MKLKLHLILMLVASSLAAQDGKLAKPAIQVKPAIRVKPEKVKLVETLLILRDHMRNPDSFKLSKVWVVDDSTAPNTKGTVCYTYRAQNGFGGLNVETAAVIDDVLRLPGGVWTTALLINAACFTDKGTARPGRDVTQEVQEGLTK